MGDIEPQSEYPPPSVRTRACMSSLNWRITVSIFSGMPKRASANPQQFSVDGVIRFQEGPMTHTGGFSQIIRVLPVGARQTTCRLFDRAGQKPHCCSSGSIPASSQYFAVAGRDYLPTKLCLHGQQAKPPFRTVVAIRTILLSVKDIDGDTSFQCWVTSPVFRTSTIML